MSDRSGRYAGLETWSVFWSFFSMNKEGKYFVLLKSARNSGVVLFVTWSLGGILLYLRKNAKSYSINILNSNLN